MRSIGLVLEGDLDDGGEMTAEELEDALVKIEAYGADFFALADALDLEDLRGLPLGDLEVWSLDLDLGLMREGLEDKL